MPADLQTLWASAYDKDVPRSLEYPNATMLDLMRATARERPDATALIFKGTKMPYRELDRLANSLASALRSLGVAKGDRIALILPNSPQAVIALFATWAAGAIAVPINPLYTERELQIALNEAECATAFVLTPFYEKLKNIQAATPVRLIIATNIKEYLPAFTRFLFTVAKEKKEGHRVQLRPGDLALQDLLAEYVLAGAPPVNVGRDDYAVLLFTGGTTGVPKAAIGTHRAIVTSGTQYRTWFGPLLQPWTDIIMMNLPLFHVMGLNGVLATGIINRSPLCLVPNPRDIDDMVKTIAGVRPAFLPGVPTLYVALLNHPAITSGKASLRSLKLCISAAAPLMRETKERFEKLTGARIVEGYSLTESMLAACMTPVLGKYKPGSVGVPLPDIDIRIVDSDGAEKNRDLGEAGEILMRAPQLMRGYWRRSAESSQTIRSGWLYTGDIGYIDDDGYVFIIDRKKDVIKTSGFQVWPREIEEILTSHPAVAEAGVAGVPDEHRGEAVKAWVVLRAGQTATAEELRQFMREKLSGYKVPKAIEFRDALPKSPIGKVLRRALVEEAAHA